MTAHLLLSNNMLSHHQNPPFSFFCEEEYCDDNSDQNVENSEPFLDLLWDDEELSSLLDKEQENELYSGLEENPSLAKARGEAVEWIIKVIGYYSFSGLTAVLAVNYLDRFLYNFQSHRDKPWVAHLAAVASLSLAAKVNETQVPLLLDLQVEESKYVFEPRTIQRMEILVLSTLEWKMNPVTPLSFLDYMARKLALNSPLSGEFLRRSEYLILSVISDSRFMLYEPSALATATMLYVISSIKPCIGLEYHDQLLGILGINKDKVQNCCRLMQEVTTSIHFNKRKFGSLPRSPERVFDVSFTSDTSNDSWAVASSSPDQPLSKKIKSNSVF